MTTRLLPRYDVLARDQRQQAFRVELLGVEADAVKGGDQGAGIGDERRDQPRLGGRVAPGDVGLCGVE